MFLWNDEMSNLLCANNNDIAVEMASHFNQNEVSSLGYYPVTYIGDECSTRAKEVIDLWVRDVILH